MGSQRMRSQKFKRIQILHRCHLVFFCQIRHFVIHFRSMECKYRISLKIFFQSHFHMFPAAGSGSMRSQRPFHSWVVSVSPDQVPAPFQRFLCTGGVTGSIFHYGLPRNSTYSHLIHDMFLQNNTYQELWSHRKEAIHRYRIWQMLLPVRHPLPATP